MRNSKGTLRGDVESSRPMARKLGGLFTLPCLVFVGAAACCGCQTMFPAALPGGFAWSENARIEKKAKADSFPSPADVGLTQPTSVP